MGGCPLVSHHTQAMASCRHETIQVARDMDTNIHTYNRTNEHKHIHTDRQTYIPTYIQIHKERLQRLDNDCQHWQQQHFDCHYYFASLITTCLTTTSTATNIKMVFQAVAVARWLAEHLSLCMMFCLITSCQGISTKSTKPKKKYIDIYVHVHV